ncbi:HD-GYP domain-containing protein [Wenjunlia tyrosinilytica]|uniref:Lipoprotein n=1 Tax=Wenjunlia tyrosinilytica TaxID=1544741 RepID=A0A918DVT1_9ACTN|nr:HD domain-containing protein [Wenjunlia tyrosinilytica]GGO85659.1 lipoprotein [Wenjunlia tyrosinilytica]
MRRCAAPALCLVAAVLFAVSVGWTLWHGLAQPSVALAFAVFVAAGEGLRITLPGERTATPLGTAGALAYAVLGQAGGTSTSHGVPQVVAVCGTAMLLGSLPRLRRTYRRPLGDLDPDQSRKVLTVAFTATLYQPLDNSGALGRTAGQGPLYIAFMALLLALAALFDTVLAAALTHARSGRHFPALLRDEVRALMGIGSAVCATGVIMAVAAGVMGLWALPVFSVPLLLTQVSFRRHAAVRATYRQTIVSLSRATEVAGYTPEGHARRVSRLSCEVGRALGMAERDLLLLEYAALMHDIGQLALVDPVPGGATAVLDQEEQRRIAGLGGEVVRQTGVPVEVAVIVERQAEPFRDREGALDPSHPLASSIVRAANAFDDFAGADGGLAGRLEAVERLRLSTAREYEPRVVEALADVCLRGGPGPEPGLTRR